MIDNSPSSEAIEFLNSAEPVAPWHLANGGVDELRADEHEEAVRNNQRIMSDSVLRLEETEIGGVRVLVITPKGYDKEQDNKAVLYFFGGAYVVGSPHVDLPISAGLAMRLGVKVYSPYYRRAPEHPCPAAIDDAFAVYRDMGTRIAAENIALVGESAGGNLALSVALQLRKQEVTLPAALALLSPWCDVTPTGDTQKQPPGFDPTLDYESHLREAAAAYAGSLSEKDPRVSPIYASYRGGFPPTLITTGTRELFLSDCQRLSARLEKAGVDVTLRVWDGMWHAFEWYADIPEAQRSLSEIANFLRAELAA